MKVDGKHWRSIWLDADGWSAGIVDQTRLPHRFETAQLTVLEDTARAISSMQVRGAPLIGAAAAYGLCLALRQDPSDRSIELACETLAATRPTAANLRWALDQVTAAVRNRPQRERAARAYRRAAEICDQDVETNKAIGRHGQPLIDAIATTKRPAEPVKILTHCNAGWLATVDWGTATAPIYLAHDRGVAIHVLVDETRPRNQGALTAWELGQHGVPHTVIVDNAGGHLLQRGEVDLVIVGSDRVAANGDAANKIGTYLKALAARANGVPFYVALPSPTIDFSIREGGAIPIEERNGDEVATVSGRAADGRIERVRVLPENTSAANPAFDVTPANLISGFITERGVIAPSALAATFPERVGARPAAE
jgi:methylthioribose-1-phosphate isomerase